MSLKLFYLTTEIDPFASTSHLGKYSVHIPYALQNLEHDIRIMIPKYGFVSERKYILREVIRLREILFEFNGEDVMTSAKSAFIPKTRVQVYFLENAELFKDLTTLLYKQRMVVYLLIIMTVIIIFLKLLLQLCLIYFGNLM